MHWQIRRNLAAKIAWKWVCLVIGQFGLDVKQPVIADIAIERDPALVHQFALDFWRAQFGRMIFAIRRMDRRVGLGVTTAHILVFLFCQLAQRRKLVRRLPSRLTMRNRMS